MLLLLVLLLLLLLLLVVVLRLCAQLYHEAVIVNLLETTMYHSDACEAADDSITDFIDYLHRKLTYLAYRSV